MRVSSEFPAHIFGTLNRELTVLCEFAESPQPVRITFRHDGSFLIVRRSHDDRLSSSGDDNYTLHPGSRMKVRSVFLIQAKQPATGNYKITLRIRNLDGHTLHESDHLVQVTKVFKPILNLIQPVVRATSAFFARGRKLKVVLVLTVVVLCFALYTLGNALIAYSIRTVTVASIRLGIVPSDYITRDNLEVMKRQPFYQLLFGYEEVLEPWFFTSDTREFTRLPDSKGIEISEGLMAVPALQTRYHQRAYLRDFDFRFSVEPCSDGPIVWLIRARGLGFPLSYPTSTKWQGYRYLLQKKPASAGMWTLSAERCASDERCDAELCSSEFDVAEEPEKIQVTVSANGPSSKTDLIFRFKRGGERVTVTCEDTEDRHTFGLVGFKGEANSHFRIIGALQISAPGSLTTLP